MELRTRVLRLAWVVLSVSLTECGGTVSTGSGGLGAVSFGVSEWIVEGVIVLLVLVVLFGAWKLVKIILAAISG